MSTITKEFAQDIINGHGYGVELSAVEALARIALAAMDSEPMAWLAIYHGEVYDEAIGITRSVVEAQADHFGWESALTEIIPLYRHAQQPVVPDERAAFNAWNNEDNLPIAGVGAKNAAWLAWQARASLCGNSVLDVPPERLADSSDGDDVGAWFDEGWNACRAAMLQGKADGALTNECTIPATQIKPVADLYGISVPGGRTTTYSTDAAEASDCRVMGWSVQEYVKLERYQSAMLQGAENAESPTTMKTAPALDSSPKIAESPSGNSPVIPDGYVMVPKEPTPEMLAVINEAIKSMRGSAATYARVLAAAPQEAK